MMDWICNHSKKPLKEDSDITFSVNGENHTVPANQSPDMALCDYLRDHLHLTGTKYMCREGTCGSCVVAVKKFNPILKEEKTISVNSCLLPLYSCAGLDIITIDGIGDRKKGYHPVQKRLAEYNGTQCGFCSPGMVMTMYSLLEKEKNPAVQDVEDLFDGNMCRCTGYRSILDAMKSFSKVNELQNHNGPCVKSTPCITCPRRAPEIDHMLYLKLDESDWYRPMTLDELFQILKENDGKKIQFVVGNTVSGIYKDEGPFDLYIDIKGIEELNQCDISDSNCTLGANCPLGDFMEILYRLEKKSSGFSYCAAVARHIQKVATTHVRNVGSWAGNLMAKKAHRDFPSDIFSLLEAVHAKLTIGHYDGTTKTMSPLELLGFDMKGRVVLNLQLTTFSPNHHFNSFKIMPRSQSSQAYVNGAFLIEVDKSNDWKVLSKPSILFGGISAEFTHAAKTEEFLVGKPLCDPNTLRGSLASLESEIKPDPTRIVGDPQYRKQLAINLYYKFLLGVLSETLSERIKSGAGHIHRAISSGTQTYDTNEADWPINKPMPKLEAQVQCSGEAEYVMDIPRPPGTLRGAFVLSTLAKAVVKSIDFSEAEKLPGVVKVLTYKDIPGENNIYPLIPGLSPAPEQLFCSDRTLYAGQPLALVVAESQPIASEAVKLVQVTYEDPRPPIITLEEAMKNPSEPLPEDIHSEIIVGDADAALKTAPHVIKGEVKVGSQFHIHMETQVALCIPTEDGMDVMNATQWPDLSQESVSQVLGKNKSSFNVRVRRLGGAYGGKITRCLHTVAGCGLAAHVTNKPVFLHLDVETNMESLGKRNPLLAQYEAGFDNDGKLLAVKVQYFMDIGCLPNETVVGEMTHFARNVYECPNWSLVPRSLITDLPSNTWVRAPGTAKGIFVTEVILERIAKVLKKDPLDIKALNMMPTIPKTDGQLLRTNIRDIYSDLRKNAEVDKRLQDIATYNKNNRWKKKGLSIVPMKYDIRYDMLPFTYTAMVSIYKGDGTVAVVHSGIEMGQGINTKVAQVCARELGISMDMISVKVTNSLTAPNAFPTGASTGSELNCKAVMECCRALVKRLQPVREELKNPPWKDLIFVCWTRGMDLSEKYMYGPKDGLQNYSIYGATCAEAEIDVLTGEHEIHRVDMIFDCGQSLSPEIDIGQIEGAFVMGMGLFLLEEVKYDPKTGKNLTHRLFEYFVPASKDIPADFRITLLKNAPNPFGVLKSKASGEPPLCMSSVVLLAVQSAIHAAHDELKDSNWVPLNAPATAESILSACNVVNSQLVYN